MQTKVLIVEDDFILAQMAKIQLTKHNYEVIGIADCGESAIDFCNAQTPDIILMDIQLKGEMDGIEAAKRIQEVYSSDARIVYLTGNSDPATKNRALQSGCSEYLIKPVDQEQLLEAVKKC